MLFMGSEKFPDENDYDAFLASHGGASNAYTELVGRKSLLLWHLVSCTVETTAE